MRRRCRAKISLLEADMSGATCAAWLDDGIRARWAASTMQPGSSTLCRHSLLGNFPQLAHCLFRFLGSPVDLRSRRDCSRSGVPSPDKKDPSAIDSRFRWPIRIWDALNEEIKLADWCFAPILSLKMNASVQPSCCGVYRCCHQLWN